MVEESETAVVVETCLWKSVLAPEYRKVLRHLKHKEEEITMQLQKGRGRGFASMSVEKKREIASKGGRAAHAMGTAHKWTSEEAQAAGRKGGSISRRRPKQSIQA